ncbi:hypothetical protein [Streptomyces sp. NPDC048196]|uniref:hypothetical protein n=1 Tax=Streptomyces sp. NPDC048196 TaxID=3154712 RepID=UPI0033E1DE52
MPSHEDEALDQLINRGGPLPPGPVKELALGLAEVLVPLHAAGAAHGGLAPSTILVTSDGPRPTRSGSPAPTDSSADDIRALAKVLLFAATGVSRPGPYDLAAVADPSLRSLIADCLAEDPAVRLTAAQILQRLRPQPVAIPPMPSGPPPLPPTPPSPTRIGGRRGPVVPLVAVLATILAAALALTAWGPGSSSTAASHPPVTPPGASGRPSHAPQGKSGFAWSLTKADTGTFVGLWSTPSTVVLGTDTGLTSYDVATGKRLWTWKPPHGGLLCNMSHSTSEGIGAFVYGRWAPKPGIERCDRLQTVSVDSGRLGWAHPVGLVAEGSTGFPDRVGGESLSISGNVVSAPFAGPRTRDHGGTDLLTADVPTGQVRWSTDFGAAAMPNGCQLSGHAQALTGTVYAVAQCGSAPRLLAFGAASPTTPVWESPLPGCKYPVSHRTSSALMTVKADHLLVGCDLASPGAALYTLSPEASRLLPVDTSGAATITASYDYAGVHAPANVPMNADTLYLVKGENTFNARSDGVIAVDLATGRQRWSTTLPGVSSVTLVSPTDTGVEVWANAAGRPSLYTVAGPDRVTKGPALKSGKGGSFAADDPVRPPRGVRVGGHLALAFSASYGAHEMVLGVLRSGSAP